MNFAQLLHPSSLRRLFGAHDRTAEDEEDREDIAYLRMARKDASSFCSLRDVMAEIEAKDQSEERGKLRRPITQTG
jgi:hypothetical protein